MKLSVALATYNEEENIGRCLRAVSGWADEIVIVDGGSTDRTVTISREFHARVLIADNPAIFHINKQSALDACRGIWILQLDADEVVTSELKQEITELITIKNKAGLAEGYFIPRKNYFLGKWMKKGGMYPDYVIRLLRRGKGRFPCVSVHEQIHIDGSVGYLTNPLEHYTAPDLKSYWLKAGRYIDLKANEFHRDITAKNIVAIVKYTVLEPVRIFFSLYVRHKGILDGWRGMLFALFSAVQVPMAYIKYFTKHVN